MKLNDNYKILLAFCLIIFSNILGNKFPPSSIALSPITIGLLTGFLVTTNIKWKYRMLLIMFGIALNDLFIKTYSGDKYDAEGAGFIQLFFIIGLIVSFLIVCIKTILDGGLKAIHKLGLIMLFPMIMIPYVFYFSSYGLTYALPMSATKQEAIEKNTFLFDLDLSPREIVYKEDSIQFISGWAEQEVVINHQKLFRKKVQTEYVNYKILVRHNFESHLHALYYQINSINVNGLHPIDSVIEFCEHHSTPIVMNIFKLHDDSIKNEKLIGKVSITPK